MALGGGETTKHTDAAQKAWQKMLFDTNELGETTRKAQTNAMAGLSRSARENAKTIAELAHVAK